VLVAACVLLASASPTAVRTQPVLVPLAWPEGIAPVQVEYLGSIAKDEDLSIRRGFWSRLVDIAAGAPGRRLTRLSRPFTPATDAEGRLLVADPGTPGVHLFDLKKRSHKVLRGPSRLPLKSPIGVDSDDLGNIYVSDSASGRIFVFDRDGRFTRFIGEMKNEGYFKRPTGLAVDRAAREIYLTDTLHHTLYVVSTTGTILRSWGRRGSAPGEFNFPAAVALADHRVFVLDSMNFRVQVFTPDGRPIASFGHPANEPGGFFRPKGLAIDTANKLVLVVDAMFEAVQAFTYDGRLVFAFGHGGSGPGEFQLPAGISVHPDGRLLVADSYNARIQLFRLRSTVAGGIR
jgi:DNA-binding beta-propeller fold protein YncE